MYDVQFLCERFGLTVKQVRDRLTTLSPTLTEHVLQGKHGAKVLTEGGLAIFDRLLQLERGGLSVSAAAEKIEKEAAEEPQASPSTTVRESSVNGESKVIEILTNQIDDLRLERDRLLSLLEGKDEQIRALMPGPSEPKPNGKENGLTRWRALRYAFFGR